MNWIFHASPKNDETAVLIIVLLLALFGTWTLGGAVQTNMLKLGSVLCWLQNIPESMGMFAKHQVRNSSNWQFNKIH